MRWLRGASGTVALIVGLALVEAPSLATSVKTWSPSSRDDFAAGTLDGTALDEQGHLRLSPAFETLWGPEEGVVWVVAPADPRGVAVALSGPARMLRLQAGKPVETWYESTDAVLVTALAPAPGKGFYIGLSPLGQVLHAVAADERRALFETGAEFVWSLVVGDDGGVWAGTGTPGRLIRYTRKDGPETVLESEHDPVRCLAPLPGGGVVAGTGARGRVIRIGPDGRAFVLLDAEESEIVSLATTPDGTVYALAAGAAKKKGEERPSRAGTTGGVSSNTVTVRASPPEETSPPSAAESPKAAEAAPVRDRAAGGALYRLDPDGGSRRIWKSSSETPYVLVARQAGRLLVGTGDAGRVLELNPRGEGTALLRFPSDRVSAMALSRDGAVLLGGTEDARVAVLGPDPAETGTYLSAPLDAGGVADWGRIGWNAGVPAGANLELDVRSGNTADPDETWSEWAAPDALDPLRGATAPAPPARWFQVRVRMRPAPDGRSPVLSRIELSYRPRNNPPEIRSLSVEPVGIAWRRVPTQSQNRGGPLVADDPVARSAARALRPQARSRAPIRRSYEAGVRTFTWEAVDPDGDSLSYALEIRTEPDGRWFPLRDGIDETFYSWDSRAMPGGLYRVRLTADDSADNPAGKELTANRISEPLRVDNTPPVIVDFVVRESGGRYEISFTARDPNGRVEAVEYDLNGRGWKALDPVDGVADSEVERYELQIEAQSIPRPAHMAVRVTDPSGNLGGDMRILE